MDVSTEKRMLSQNKSVVNIYIQFNVFSMSVHKLYKNN